MSTSLKAFKIELYQEHLEEASFLYEQRLGLLKDPEISWRGISDFEERLEAHIDALVVGDELALEVCKQRAQEGDFGELFAAVCVFCRQKRGSKLSEVFQALDFKEEQKIRAVGDALKHEFPAEWGDALNQALARQDERLAPILAQLCGYRRIERGDLLHQVLAANPAGAHPLLIRALGKLKWRSAEDSLVRCLQHPDENVCLEALLALLHIGELRPLQQCYLLAQSKRWPCIAFGLAGNRSAANLLKDLLKGGKANEDCVLALGLLGDLSAVKPLLECLANPDLADAAATALHLITGAEMNEEVFVPEEIDEDELFENELKAYKEEGKVPTRADGKPFGTTQITLSTDPEKWRAWLTQNAPRFDPNHRYRYGKLYSPKVLLEGLLADFTPYRIRQLTAEELAIRYGLDIPFEADMPVNQQIQALGKISRWAEEHAGKFQAGLWYFAGRVMT